ncbi:hypothetical protein PYCCODRAFT_1433951 [Trametes coccinea BRFM310]|uniref:Uncharacterized protein n=1 Tax=Trametes coccinea (strain BRFM310) TaxID=1353009 RepID=A0A1Y2ISB8_TRAC3|nr:hypothetical protein PYCCODRAFT_1433951 [Trametes coccinea BRFM310]
MLPWAAARHQSSERSQTAESAQSEAQRAHGVMPHCSDFFANVGGDVAEAPGRTSCRHVVQCIERPSGKSRTGMSLEQLRITGWRGEDTTTGVVGGCVNNIAVISCRLVHQPHTRSTPGLTKSSDYAWTHYLQCRVCCNVRIDHKLEIANAVKESDGRTV